MASKKSEAKMQSILYSEEMQKQKKLWKAPITNYDLSNYIDLLFAKSNIEPVSSERGLSCDLWEGVVEALESKDMEDNEIVREILRRGKEEKGKKKWEPFVIPPSDLIEFLNYVVSYILYTHLINTIPFFNEWEFSYTNYYLRNQPNIKYFENWKEEDEE